MSETQQDLQALVAQLSKRLDAAEAEIAELRRRSDASIPEDVIMAISAAVSAYLGNRGKVKAVHFSRHRTWAAQGRQTIQQHSIRAKI
ncbi:hypothetical protein NQ015_08700 [Corynebacterium sp. 153RC1]|uniref:hypothetical protein n=1 Tax=Corynebacterium TaxID=1716 RepID=UPI00211C2400|nr:MULTISPECIES: hypothetical protein [unclassified Corynebacterium]MCQ9370907.1 hypothetical protein [Corynebacterium sp. 35RC1]MCQ9344066.1 hypothetical protein [Corynebacterium sp. 76QC2CO]MCQ9353102.1 hypothetical protein [Corynebacterium sp. 209RC1]MCQ9355306.1 hypothetical protein [Corynebacterium sp. 1222RC1]MCQ9357593.1 hypothetical protein [Corynebacterium sp. 122RC1]